MRRDLSGRRSSSIRRRSTNGLLPTCRNARALPVSVGAQKWLNPASCVVFAPNGKFDFSYFKRVISAGRPLSGSYLPYIAESMCECFDLYGEEADPPLVSDGKVRAAFVAFDMMRGATSMRVRRTISPPRCAPRRNSPPRNTNSPDSFLKIWD